MGLDLVEAVKGQLSPALLGRVGSAYGLSPDAAGKVTQSALPTVISSITSMAGTERGASKLLTMLPHDGRRTEGELIAPLDDIKQVSSFGQGALGPLFGDKLGGVVGALSQSSGLGASNATGILGLMTSLGLGVLGRHVASNHLDAQGLGQLFGAKAPAREAAPYAEVPRATRAPETRAPESVAPVYRREVAQPAVAQPAVTARAPSPARWVLPAVALLGALVLFWGLSHARRPAPEAVAPQHVEQVTPPGTGSTAPAVTSPTATLEQALQPGSNVGLPYRIPMDLHYQTGSAEVPAAATTELAALGKALSAHPSARVQVLGHTDGTGDPAANQQLSERRAGAVKDALVSAGASPNQVDARGEGAAATGDQNAADRSSGITLTSR
jgi:outer membrane protein OmpA-like peptidoglycan-associated protein